jgi:regulator of nucleoside diphosphate kinase
MENRSIYITEFDHQRLTSLIREAEYSSYRGSDYLKKLRAELERAQIVAPRAVPPDVITMNSRVRLEDVDAGDEMIFTLVFPEDADIAEGKISILAPVGTAMLGYRVNDTFEWEVPGGVSRMRVKELLYQPEAAGDYHL